MTSDLQYVDLASDILFLIGANNAGKSSLLHSYDFARVQKKRAEPEDFFQRSYAAPIVVQARLVADRIEDTDEQTRKWYNSERTAIVRKVWEKPYEDFKKYSFDWSAGEWVSGGFGGFDSILQKEMPEPIWLKAVMSEEEILDTIRELVKEVVLAKVRGAAQLEAAEVALRQLAELIEGDSFLAGFARNVSESLCKVFPGAEVSITNSPATKGALSLFEKQAQVEIGMTDSPRLGFARHGHGLQRQCALSILEAVARETTQAERAQARAASRSRAATSESTVGRILLIEEPELFLGPSAIRVARDTLYALAATDRFQVVAATHSPLMLNLSMPKHTVARVWKTNAEGSRIFQFNPTSLELSEIAKLNEGSAINPYYSEAFFFDSVIVTEGETEAIALRELLERSGVPEVKQPFLLVAGGNNSVPIYQRLCITFGIPHYCIYDLEDSQKKGDWERFHSMVLTQSESAERLGVPSRLFIQSRNFETAHGIESGGDKKTRAREFARSLSLEAEPSAYPVLKFMRLVLGSDNDWPAYDIDTLRSFDAATPR